MAEKVIKLERGKSESKLSQVIGLREGEGFESFYGSEKIYHIEISITLYIPERKKG